MAQTEVTAAVTESPEPTAPLRTPFEWVRFACYANEWDAHIVTGLLENEGVLTTIETNGMFPGTMGYTTVWVPQSLAHRARWILALLPPTEAELIFMATGELAS